MSVKAHSRYSHCALGFDRQDSDICFMHLTIRDDEVVWGSVETGVRVNSFELTWIALPSFMH